MRFGDEARAYRPDDAVAADSAAAIAQEARDVGRQVDLAALVKQQHEVVLGAVPLGEVEGRG